MPRSKVPVSEMGVVNSHREGMRAHIQFRADDEEQKHIYGPNRSTDEEAQKDLDQIRAAGGVGATREEGLKIMAAEAQRIKMSAEYQSQIQETIQRRVSLEIIDESDYENERSDNSVPEWMQEYPSEEDSPEESSQPARPTSTPLEATAELTKFRPIISKPSELQHLLECNADPNMPVKLGDISPLRKVISFAAERYVVEMRKT